MQGEQFEDISGISGLDDIADGRAFTLLDYDRDGWRDVALVNSNAPLFALYRNLIGERKAAKPAGVIGVRFVGGNATTEPSESMSNRDGYGARVYVDLVDMRLQREHRAGEGFAGQNSSTMLIGIGQKPGVESITVRWPSGTTQEIGKVPAGTLMTVYENPAQSPTGEPAVFEPYGRMLPTGSWETIRMTASGEERLDVVGGGESGARVVMYTTMATWCIACQEELPALERLRSEFSVDQLAMYAVPVDPEDSVSDLREWVNGNNPPYELLVELPEDRVERVMQRLNADLKIDAIPATILTDGEGRVLKTMFGEPSISEIHSLLAKLER
jgi:thiol-disulfide isomerase/thioredoxin